MLASDDLDFRFDIGYCKPVTIDNKSQLVASTALHFTIYQVKAALDQFIEGLETLGIHSLIKKHPESFFTLFCGKADQHPLTADDFLSLFQPDYAPSSSNDRETEEALILNWNDFMQDVERGAITSGKCHRLA